jgi:hypothetical protein
MNRAILYRMDKSDQGVFGRIVAPKITLFTGELPDRGNQPNISCVHEGIFRVEYTFSPRFKRFMYLLIGVRGRSGVRKHSANLMGDTALGYKAQLNGCIALGEKLGWIDGQKALLLSSPAIRRFEESMQYKPFDLEIRNA